ncbi:MAG: DUF6691 family protein [Stellaceae bacterium]
MKTMLSALICGLLFGAGLVISGMTETQKVQGFLDLFGDWDPSLAVVMASALIVSFGGFRLVRRRARPLFEARALWPTKQAIDRPLVIGAALFGAGWGLIGFCPGPALTDLSTGAPMVVVFVVAMAAGMVADNLLRRRHHPPAVIGSEQALEANCG